MDSDQENQATTASEDNHSSNSSESSVDTQQDFSKFSVDELKSKLKEAGLPVSGKKADLIERLESSLSESSDDKSEETSGKTDSDEDSDKPVVNPLFPIGTDTEKPPARIGTSCPVPDIPLIVGLANPKKEIVSPSPRAELIFALA